MEKQKIINLINENLSQREIAERLGCSQSSIKYWLKKFDLKTNYGNFNKSDKFCPKCKITKTLENFYKRNDRENGVSGYCKNCSNAYHAKRVKNVKIKMINHMGNECADCHITYPERHYSVFDFHHLDPTKKDPNFIKIKFQKWEKIEDELSKCVMLCSNCHRERHAKINGW